MKRDRAILIRSAAESNSKGISDNNYCNYFSGGPVWSKPSPTPSAVIAATGTEDAQQDINIFSDVAQINLLNITSATAKKLPFSFNGTVSPSFATVPHFKLHLLRQILRKT